MSRGGEVLGWAREVWPWAEAGEIRAEAMVPDGSLRRFFRLRDGRGRSAVVMDHGGDIREAAAWAYFRDVLAARGVRVPGIMAMDEARGWLLVEDLGTRLLHERVLEVGGGGAVDVYEEVLKALVRLQAGGLEGLNWGMCTQEAELGPRQMIRREAGYFIRELVMGACGLGPERLPAGLGRALWEISRRAGSARPRVLIHRDFQSRNILVLEEGGVGIVDFQGARMGPAQYDLVSLVHDPYVQLPWQVREELVERYLELARGEGLELEGFREGLDWVAASRLMQALGAYAFLSRRRARTSFSAYVAPALESLGRLARRLGVEPLERLVDMLKQMEAHRRLEGFGA